MKTNSDFRVKGSGPDPDDAIKRGVKLAPIKKSGKEKHRIYSDLDDDPDEDDLQSLEYRQRESVLDYFDDGEEDDL